MPGNQEVIELWGKCSTQWRVGFGGAIGLDGPGVEWVAEKHGIEITVAMLAKLQVLERVELQAQADRMKEKSGTDNS